MKKRMLCLALAGVLTMGSYSVVSAGVVDKAIDLLYDYVVTDEEIDFSPTGVAAPENTRLADYQGETDDWDISPYSVELEDGLGYEIDATAHLIAQYPKYKIIRLFNLTTEFADESNPVDITIADIDIKDNKRYGILHMNVDTGEWDNTCALVLSVQNGLVRARVCEEVDNAPFALAELK